MKTVFLVSFIRFCPDNYQGGSGNWFEGKVSVAVDWSTPLSLLREELNKGISASFPAKGWADEYLEVTKIELLVGRGESLQPQSG